MDRAIILYVDSHIRQQRPELIIVALLILSVLIFDGVLVKNRSISEWSDNFVKSSDVEIIGKVPLNRSRANHYH